MSLNFRVAVMLSIAPGNYIVRNPPLFHQEKTVSDR